MAGPRQIDPPQATNVPAQNSILAKYPLSLCGVPHGLPRESPRPYHGVMATGTGLPDDVEDALAASRALLAVVATSLVEILDRMTLAQFRILVVLSESGPLRSGDLAERVGVHQSTLTRTANRLVDAGFITREVGSASRREVIVDLTGEGRALVLDVMARRRRELARILHGAGVADRRVIVRGLRAFARAAGEPEPGRLLSLGV
jgi:DNA-binding MarR family transcriptional regulator